MTAAAIELAAGKVAAGERLTRDDAAALYRHAPTHQLGRLADLVRARKHPEGVVTYIVDRNVNYTNVCVARCNFCAFYREVGSPDGYVLGFDEIFSKIDETIALGGVQLLLQGGHNPDLPLTWYEDLFRAVKQRYPDFKLHALSPPEVVHLSRLSQLPVRAVLERLVAAGIDSIPGGGAEILVDRVRRLLNCYSKASTSEWLGVMETAHELGLRTTATMMYGSVEHPEERIDHLLRLREVQDRTGGFTAFITWSYQPPNTELGGSEATGVEYLRTLAIARLVLDNFDNLQASWVTQGGTRPVEPDVRRERHGQRHDRGKRRAGCRRRVLHGRGGDYPQRRGCRVRGAPSQHALRDPRRALLPPARGAALHRTGRRPGGGRRARAAGTRPLSGAHPGRQAPPAGFPVNPPGRTESGHAPGRQGAAITRYHAGWVVPIAGRPIRDGWVDVDRGVVTAVGRTAGARTGRRREVDLRTCASLPGLVNAHVHLELSGLRDRCGRRQHPSGTPE